ncbi:headcase protein homolog isoform X2 [Hyperolius riggenbachi]|uniref:headcase protein homolog isoform X2 n=1 Tax=Hyperolius riggenbachi TaxID=752182 RepID=UPI0035A3967A
MPNVKNSKGKKNKRANSSGDEQENGAMAAAAGGMPLATAGAAAASSTVLPAASAPAPVAAAAAAAAPSSDNRNEAACATPLICSIGRPIDLEKDDYQKVLCNNEHCPYGTWMHLQCFYEWESSILVQFNCIGRARSWNEKQCRQNMWTKKGYDLAFRFCSCRCGQGHLKKDTDWYQVKRMHDDRKKKCAPEKPTGRSVSESSDDVKKCRATTKPQKGLTFDPPRRPSVDRQNSQEKAVSGGSHGLRSPCVSPGQSPPAGYPILSPSHFNVPRSSRYLGRLMHLYAVCVDCLEGVHKIICIKCKSRWDGSWHQLGTMYTYDILAASPCCQARLNCKHCGKPVIDVRIGMQYFSEYSNVQQCPHCGNLDYHFVKPFSSFKVLEAY